LYFDGKVSRRAPRVSRVLFCELAALAVPVLKVEKMSDLASKAAIQIRQMILHGDFLPGDRVAEIPLAEKLGISRTPTRAALSLLEKHGLLVSSATGGYTVRSFTLAEIRDAIDVRGTLEGLAAELVAQRGLSRPALRELNECLRRGDELVDAGTFQKEKFTVYVEMNKRLHEIIVDEAANIALKRALELNDAYPFSAARMATFDVVDGPENYRRLLVAHTQHHAIVEALESGQGGRAYALMREHSSLAKHALTIVLDRRNKIPGAHLLTAAAGSAR
jgi:GntR family transcriptional regulator, vanillate catabolism transcriptional regulator